jgi:hypothetical protein
MHAVEGIDMVHSAKKHFLDGHCMKIIAGLVFLICCVGAVGATTYYIDYTAGNDSGSGLSRLTPWKRCPGMQGFAGIYMHIAGDQFIFKGGVTWPNACFPLAIVAGGSSEGNRDYYGVDATWYAGGAWARPIFDMENAETATSNRVMPVANGLSYITIDNIEIIRFYWTGSTTYGNDQVLGYGNSTYITYKNLYIHSWTHAAYNPTTDNAVIFCGQTSAPFNPGVIIENCTIDGSLANDSIYAFYGGFNYIRFNTIHGVANGIVSLGGGLATSHQIYGNLMYDIVNSFDPAQHENALLMQGPCKIYNNTIYNNAAMHLYVDVSGVTNEVLVYNNVCWNNTGPNATILMDDYNATCTGTVRVYNNTAQGASGGTGSCVGVVNRAYTISKMIVENNHFITSAADPTAISGTVTSYTEDHNLKQTIAEATAQGYTSSNIYAPIQGGSTIDMGTSEATYFTTDILGVTRPSGSLWDIGAYEFAGQSAVLSPKGLRLKQ